MSIGKRVLQQKHLDLAGVHAALLPSGKVLFFSYFAPEENNVNLAKWQLWQEDQGRSHQKASTWAGTCSAAAIASFRTGACWLLADSRGIS